MKINPELNLKDCVSMCIQKMAAERSISLHQLAIRANISPSTLYSLTSRNRRDVSLLTIEKLLKGLDISISDFFSDSMFNDY